MMDSYLLLFTGLSLRQSTTCLRIFLAGTLGSLYSCTYTVFVLRTGAFTGCMDTWMKVLPMALCTLISYVLICILMLCLAFGIHDKYSMMKNMAVFYGTAVFTGGILQSVNNFFTMNHCLFFTQEKETQLSQGLVHLRAWLWLLLGAGLSFCAGSAMWRLRWKHQREKNTIYNLRLEFKNEYVHIKALLDTGNQMYDPVDFRPVSVVEAGALTKVLNNMKDKRIRAVPYRSLGNAHGVLYTVKADRVMICGRDNVWQYENAYVGIYPGILCKTGAYHGILHPDMLLYGQKL